MGIFLVLVMLSLSAQAQKKYAYIVGEAENPDLDQFKNGFAMLGLISDSKKWSTEFLTRELTNQSRPFTKENFQNQLDGIKARLGDADKKMPKGTSAFNKGDQVLIYIDTHGNQKSPKEKTHAIATLDEDVQLDQLQKIIDLADSKGVKVAIVDQSCYSGEILNLDFKSACLLTGASQNNYGYSNYGETFAFKLQDSIRKEKRSTSLEDIFLSSRKVKSNRAQPLINTEAGLKTFEFLKSVEPYLYQDELPLFDDTKTCQNFTGVENNRLDLLKVSLKAQIKDQKIYDDVMKSFKALSIAKTNYDENLDSVRRSRADLTSICTFFSESKRYEGEKLFPCKEQIFEILEPKPDGLPHTFEELANRKLIRVDEKMCFSQQIDFKLNINKFGLKGCATLPVEEFDPKKLQKTINKNQLSSDRLQEILDAVKNLKDKDRLLDEIADQKYNNKNAKKAHKSSMNKISSLEAEIYDKLYNYFKKTSKNKDACASFKLN
jgi:hypothetical protein